MADEKAKICWISGSYYRSKEIIEKIKSSLDNPSVEIYDDEASAEYIEQQIFASGLFSSSRLIILKDIPAFKGSPTKSNEKWKNIFSEVPEDCTIVIDRVDLTKRVLHKHVKEVGKVFELPSYLKKQDMGSYITSQLENRGKSIPEDALNCLIEKIGESTQEGTAVDLIHSTILQLCDFIGKRRKNITKDDILFAVPNNYGNIIWDIFTALDKKDLVKCEKLFYGFCRNSSVEEATNQICNMILWRFRLLFLVKEQKSNKIPENEIISNILKLKKVEKEGSAFQSVFSAESEAKSQYTENVVNNMVKGFYSQKSPVENYTRTEIFKFIKIVYENLLKLRTAINEIDYYMIMDNLFMSLCGTIEPNVLEKLRENIYNV
jgi:DNA polymerase III delta subunit